MRRTPRLIWMMTLPLLTLSTSVLADEPDLLKHVTEDVYIEPGVPGGGPAPLFGIAIALILAVMVVGVSLMPSKRGHQD
ncbi:MAG: hypothetical protein P8I91_08945 [Phycisphaerales bacterium]|nr:hypothetical protein [Phycisphaerales bacterium]